MKTRSDFVSNSSSSSFIVADLAARSKDKLALDIAKLCCSKKQKTDAELKAMNKCVLEYCIRNYTLLYFGSIVLGKRRQIITAETYKDIDYDEDEAQAMWNQDAQILIDIENGKTKDISKEEIALFANKKLDLDKKQIIEYVDILEAGRPVLHDRMSLYMFYFRNFKNAKKVNADTKKTIVDQIVNYAKQMNSLSWSQRPKVPYIYSITADTVLNTKLLLKSGVKMSFDDSIWTKKMIAEVEKLLRDGKTVYYIEQGHDGDCVDSSRIYCEENAEGLAADPQLQIISSDYL